MTIRTPNNSYYVSGASGGQNHTLPFGADRFEDDDLFVYVWNTSTEAWDKKTVTTHYTVSSTQVSFTSGNIPSTRVIVLRKTDVDEDFPKADFVAGASIKAQDLDNNQMQALRGIKELRDQKLSAVPSIAEDGTPSNPKMYANLDMNGYKVINQPAGYITSTDILDGTIATADVADSAITAAKLASDSVTTAKIASDAVNGTKIADDSINSEHYVDGSIDTAHIADAQITTAKIANDAVTADKLANTAVTAGSYTAADITVDAQGRVTAASSGTIGTSEIADDAVTTAKILDANVTTAKIADDAVTTAKIADAELVELATMGGNTASALADLTQSEVQILDGATVTTAELNILDGVTATATELNQLDGNTLKASSTDFTSSSQFPSASEIDARITARIDPLGGFEAIADEDSFPATAPPAGTVVSIANANGLAVNSSGVGAGTRAGGSDAVVINGFPSTFNSTSLDDGIGLLVIATSTAHTYDFHRVVAKNEDVRQLSSDINDFKARYRIGSSNPTTDNDAGDLFFNTGTSKMLVYNATSSAWEEVQAVGDFFINTLSSSSGTGGGSATFNGSAYRFTLSNAPTYAQQLLVSINGVVQKPNSGTSQPSEGFALDGSDIILSAAPASGADFFIITIGSSVGIGTPSDNTVSTAKLTADAVTGAKIADDAVGAEHIEVLDANLQFADSAKAQFGAGNDLEIYHDGSNSYIDDSGTGALYVRGSYLAFAGINGEQLINAEQNAAVELYHDNSKKFETTSYGAQFTDNVKFDNPDTAGRDLTWEADNDALHWEDNTKATFGGGNDLAIYHDGTNTHFQNETGGFYIDQKANDNDIHLRSDDSAGGITTYLQCDGSEGVVKLFYYAAQKFQTKSDGVDVTGEVQCDSLDVDGNVDVAGTTRTNRLVVDDDGSGSPLTAIRADDENPWAFNVGNDTYSTSEGIGYQMYQQNSGSIITQARGSSAYVNWYLTTSDGSTSSTMIHVDTNRAVHLSHAGNTKLSTTSDGVDIDGNLHLDGSTDQRIRLNTAGAGGNDSVFVRGDGNALKYNTAAGSSGIHIFENNGSELARLPSTGGIAFNGDTSTANALDDYEEGTWSPTVQGSTTAGTVTYNARVGKYTKVGDRVFFELYVDWTSGTGTGNQLHISGLPFNAQSSSPDYPATTIGYFHNLTFASNSSPGALVSSGNSYIYFYSIPNGGGSNTVIGYDGSGSIILTGHYKVN